MINWFKIDDKEFGETYHVVVAVYMLLNALSSRVVRLTPHILNNDEELKSLFDATLQNEKRKQDRLKLKPLLDSIWNNNQVIKIDATAASSKQKKFLTDVLGESSIAVTQDQLAPVQLNLLPLRFTAHIISLAFKIYNDSRGLSAILFQSFTRILEEEAKGEFEKTSIQRIKENKENKVILFIRSMNSSNGTGGGAPGSEWRNLHEYTFYNLLSVITKKGINNIILVGQEPTFLNGAMLSRSESVKFYKMFNINSLSIGNQISLYNDLITQFRAKFLIGMMSGALDGPAFTGMPTIFLISNKSNSADRMLPLSKCVLTLKSIKFNEKHFKKNNYTLDNLALNDLETAITGYFPSAATSHAQLAGGAGAPSALPLSGGISTANTIPFISKPPAVATQPLIGSQRLTWAQIASRSTEAAVTLSAQSGAAAPPITHPPAALDVAATKEESKDTGRPSSTTTSRKGFTR